MMGNAGGAWDNSKKLCEKLELKKTDQGKACVVGDTVGDPFKDTSGPSLDILLKLMAMVSLLIAPLIEGKEDWSQWYIGIALLLMCIIATLVLIKVGILTWRDPLGAVEASADKVVPIMAPAVVEAPLRAAARGNARLSASGTAGTLT
uniref:H(+)-exporting diphosphatase n=1 Tax=Zooxanthella nutricula TaxID=1333877 RepID=A0A7S2JX05_9DINO|mmetsp:Transcript_36933/g.111623  ORF Transcript_36933/g.111623 Transcript_36933/m.111623 type:complete len:148 (+) Transcript_36933:2-445(+)